ncbi:MAG: SMC-Scp complex subunit ScpB [Firmicutes bacterium]|nr:SMC-Scp complex subunit ScpB [Bacillota bacterium]
MFAHGEPVPLENLADAVGRTSENTKLLLAEMARRFQDAGHGIELRFIAGGYQLATKSELAPFLESFKRPKVSQGLSQAALETLAIIAYQQPVTKVHLEDIRGVNADSAVNTLLERGLIEELGRADGPGRPILFGTTEIFLKHFGLAALSDLPRLPDRQIPFSK